MEVSLLNGVVDVRGADPAEDTCRRDTVASLPLATL